MSERQVGAVVSGWAVLGVAAILAWAVYRLGGRGLDVIQQGLDGFEWSVLIVLTLGFVYGEGVRSLDRKWVPGVVERARRLRDQSVLLWILAPLYGLSLVGTERRELVRGWLGTSAIVLMVPAPWRGIIDFAVAAALSWGVVAILRRVPAAVR